ncbi:unnamed protein product [Rhizoctonia solani]|uniref:PNPLA domain-containing protein n=1 Tax=Rhizoctonia solani TaxID=456999 RepID=A0A8H3H1G9_9AGAM|nr:unnamed protein product [Rhizoctonia solani]
MSHKAERLPGLNLLSLDGGGITGLSTLLIIRELMIRLQVKNQQNTIPRPCEYFDMIAGTGTGGISAIMLGRLRMSIDDAISSYVRLMRVVFSNRKYKIVGDSGVFRSTVLERELKEIIRCATGNGDEKMVEVESNEEAQCRVIIYAMSAHSITSSLPVAFRSYTPSTAATTKCAIWEALRATTTHPRLLKGIEVDVEGISLLGKVVYGGLGCSNPTPRFLEEASREYPGRAVASITSIGSGHPKTIQVAINNAQHAWTIRTSAMIKAMKAAQEVAEGSERVAEEIGRRFANLKLGYWRPNVQQGAQGVEAHEWERLDEIAAHTQAYLNHIETGSKLEQLAEAVSQRMASLQTNHLDGCVEIASKCVRDGIRNFPSSSIRFTGREVYTGKVRAYFTHSLGGRRLFVLYGLGGVGKTQIALKCAEDLKERFMHIIFIDASSNASIQASFEAIALNRNLGKTHDDMLRWIARHGQKCLLLFDNADNPSLNLRAYLPQSEHYSVLITTRCPEFAALTDGRESVCNISGLERDEAVMLFLKTAKLGLDNMNDADKEAMNKLLLSFDYLALAVVQAGAYIWKMQLPVAQYWDKYSARRQKVLEGGAGQSLDGYSRTVHTTWELSVKQLSPRAKDLLFLIAFLRHDKIFEETFRRAAYNVDRYSPDTQPTPEQLAVEQRVKQFLRLLVDNDNWNDTLTNYVGELISFSLITYDPISEVYAVHPLVQDWAKTAATFCGISFQHSALLLGLSIDWGKSNADYAYKRQIIPHVNFIIEQRWIYEASIADRFAEVYRATGQHRNEEVLWEEIVSVRKLQLGEQHPKTLTSKRNLARMYRKKHNISEARELLELVLASQRRLLGEEDPETLNTMHDLAWTLYLQRQYAEAEFIMTKVIDSRKQFLGEQYPDTLDSMDVLASIYQAQGRLTESEVLRMMIITTRRELFGEDNLVTLQGMQNLAFTYQAQGRMENAEVLYKTIVACRGRVLGEDHPETLVSIHVLASTYLAQDRLGEAEGLYKAALVSRKQALGEDHPDTLMTMGDLAYTYLRQNRLMESENLGTAVLAARRRILGLTHAQTIMAMSNLAETCSKLGKTAEHKALQEELAIIVPKDCP